MWYAVVCCGVVVCRLGAIGDGACGPASVAMCVGHQFNTETKAGRQELQKIAVSHHKYHIDKWRPFFAKWLLSPAGRLWFASPVGLIDTGDTPEQIATVFRNVNMSLGQSELRVMAYILKVNIAIINSGISLRVKAPATGSLYLYGVAEEVVNQPWIILLSRTMDGAAGHFQPVKTRIGSSGEWEGTLAPDHPVIQQYRAWGWEHNFATWTESSAAASTASAPAPAPVLRPLLLLPLRPAPAKKTKQAALSVVSSSSSLRSSSSSSSSSSTDGSDDHTSSEEEAEQRKRSRINKAKRIRAAEKKKVVAAAAAAAVVVADLVAAADAEQVDETGDAKESKQHRDYRADDAAALVE
jgi:hypothetical protein